MKWMSAVAVTTCVLLTGVAACGSDHATKSAGSAKKDLAVKASLRIDSISNVRFDRKQDICYPTGALGDLLAIGSQQVAVVSDPDGKEIGLLDVKGTSYETVVSDGKTYYSPGICTFRLEGSIKANPKNGGIYKVTVPKLNVEERFILGNRTSIELEWREP